MTERPILFSSPMVRAILAGTKTMTRRLETSPLAKAAAGDLLWVRESYAPRYFDGGKHGYKADWTGESADCVPEPKWKPSIHMPRDASRITLRVTAARIERLHAISEADAIAEGIEQIDDPRGVAWKSYETYPDGTPHPHAIAPNISPITSFRELWQSLHGKESWEANPEVVVITFEKENRT